MRRFRTLAGLRRRSAIRPVADIAPEFYAV